MPGPAPLLPRPPSDQPVPAPGQAVDLAPTPGPTAAGAMALAAAQALARKAAAPATLRVLGSANSGPRGNTSTQWVAALVRVETHR